MGAGPNPHPISDRNWEPNADASLWSGLPARDPAGLASEEELRNSASELDTCGSIIVPSLSPANRLRVDGFRGVVREVKSVLLK